MNPTKAIRRATSADTKLADIEEDNFVPLGIKQDVYAVRKQLKEVTADLYEWRRDEDRRREGKL